MKIVDSHHHLWIPEQQDPELGYVWLRDIGAPKPFGDPTPIQRDYEWSEFAAEFSASAYHTLAGSVFLQVDAAIGDAVGEVAWVDHVFTSSGLPHAIVGFVNFASADAPKALEAMKRYETFRGVRHILSRLDDQPAMCFAPEHFLRNDTWRAQFALLDEFGLSFDAQLYSHQMLEAAEFFAQFPKVPVIIDHAGSPYDQSKKGLAELSVGLNALAQLPNTTIKLSGFGMFDREWSATGILPIVEAIFSSFGQQRIMFGSNFPVDKLMLPMERVVEQVQQAIESVHENGSMTTDVDGVLADVFAQTARRVYRLQA